MLPTCCVQLTKNGIVHISFAPCADTLIIAAGDKSGRLGLWHADHGVFQLPSLPPSKAMAPRRLTPAPAIQQHAILQGPPRTVVRRGGRRRGGAAEAASTPSSAATDEERSEPATSEAAEALASPEQGGGTAGGAHAVVLEEDGAEAAGTADDFDGVLEFEPHYQYMSGMRWAASGAEGGVSLFTLSYDGSLRALDIERGVFDLIHGDEDGEYSALEVSSDGRWVRTMSCGTFGSCSGG